MSGGSMDYVGFKIQEYTADLCDKEMTELAEDIAGIFLQAERWHSADACENQYREAVSKFKLKWFSGNREMRLTRYIDEILDKAKRECYALLAIPGEGGAAGEAGL